jgi:hypothetical protein
MHSVGQWVHQHDALLVLALALAVSLAMLLRYLRRSARHWVAWGVAAGLGVAAALAARTPAASLSGHAPAAYEELSVASVEDVRALLGRGGKPTLVEVYSDYGVS